MTHSENRARKLFYGDNLDILRKKIKDESIDLCYIDPPFNSSRNYNQIYNSIGTEDRAQSNAFDDTWTWNAAASKGLDEIRDNEPPNRDQTDKLRFTKKTHALILGLEPILGKGPLFAYLVYMTQRIVEIYRVLKSTGSFYLHCDPTASHYLKLICDAVFGGNFNSEIIWRRTGAHNKCNRWAPIHDVILFYSKSDKYTWNNPKQRYMRGHVEEHFVEDELGYKTNYYGNVMTGSGVRRSGESGMEWRGVNPTAKGRHWAIPGKLWEDCGIDGEGLSQHQKLDKLLEAGLIKFDEGQFWPIYERRIRLDDGPATSDIWAYQPHTSGTVHGTELGIDEDIAWIKPTASEHLDYETQKPVGLLERIIMASSNDGDVVLDAFCGCGTTIAAAERLGRQWMGIDITYSAIVVILKRIEDTFGKNMAEQVVLDGIPMDMKAAEALANKKDDLPRKEFEKWAILTYTNNRGIINKKKGADGGIDGVVHFMTGKNKTAKMVFQVKSGKVQRSDIAKLNSDMQREDAVMATLITLKPDTKAMRDEAQEINDKKKYKHTWGQEYDVMQIATIKEIIEYGRRLNLPMAPEVLKAAKRRGKRSEEQPELEMD